MLIKKFILNIIPGLKSGAIENSQIPGFA